MIYLNVVALIRRISKVVNPTGTFVHGRRVDGAMTYSDHYPVILLEPPTDVIDTTLDIETTSITMGFLFQDSSSSSVEDQEVLIGKADVMRREFQDLLKVEAIDLSVFRATPFYRIFAGINTGYLLTFTITNKTVTCVEET